MPPKHRFEGPPKKIPGVGEGKSAALDRLHSLEEKSILEEFKPEERELILRRKNQLSSLAYFVGKDFSMPVFLNPPGEGWHWNPVENHVRIDAKDLLEKPLPTLRYIMCHEAGHRRISRNDFVPLEIQAQPGFAFMMNAIEDPRDNNFVTEAYPKSREDMEAMYGEAYEDFEAEAKTVAKTKLGEIPRFFTAGQEYIKQWFNEVTGKPMAVNPELPADVREVLNETLSAAHDGWWLYPSKEEADASEEKIQAYAKAVYTNNLERVWPEFKKLVDADIEDQETRAMLDELKNKQEPRGKGKGEPGAAEPGGSARPEKSADFDIPEDLKEQLTEAEREELEKALQGSKMEESAPSEPPPEAAEDTQEEQASKDAIGVASGRTQDSEGGGEKAESPEDHQPAPVDVSALSPELRKKLSEYRRTRSEEEQRKWEEFAKKVLEEFERQLNEYLRSRLEEAAEKERSEREESAPEPPPEPVPSRESPPEEPPKPLEPERERQRLKDLIRQIAEEGDGDQYERALQEVLPLVRKLEDDLREIFVERRMRKWKSGFKSGKDIDIQKRIQEKVKGVSVVESRAWRKREAPAEKDYAISILVDLSGSMDNKIDETFKGVVALAEVLSALSIKTEILGFNDKMYEFKTFDQPFGDDVRQKMPQMIYEVNLGPGRRYNDDGWALKEASARLGKQDAEEKFLLPFSDGIPVPSRIHSGPEFELSRVVSEISEQTDQKLVGLGIGYGTGHVSRYYPHSIADIPVHEFPEKLTSLLREVVEHYDAY